MGRGEVRWGEGRVRWEERRIPQLPEAAQQFLWCEGLGVHLLLLPLQQPLLLHLHLLRHLLLHLVHPPPTFCSEM